MSSDTQPPVNVPLNNFQSLLDSYKLDAYLVSEDANIRYLTGFQASESWLFVSRKAAFYITDFRYIEEAKKGLPGNITVKRYQRSVFKTIFDVARMTRSKAVGLDDRHMSLAFFKELKKASPKSVRLIPRNNVIEELRQIKTAHEIRQIRQALRLHKEAYRHIRSALKPGVSEKSVLIKLENFVRAKGAGFSFDPIIASGPNSALPHARVTDRRFKRNDLILIDMGIDVQGYKSDLTRMCFLGTIPPLVRKVNTEVKTAQLKAIANIHAGARASDIDAQARNYLAKKGLAKYFGHSLGHGVGLQIHEAPRLSSVSPTILEENMVVTVEPAVYLPRRFGIRIEDMVLVTKKGCEVLSDDID